MIRRIIITDVKAGGAKFAKIVREFCGSPGEGDRVGAHHPREKKAWKGNAGFLSDRTRQIGGKDFSRLRRKKRIFLFKFP
jgi:hypothetical protein